MLAYEKVTLYGMPIVAQRRVNYGRIDPELSRELFIRHALVEGEWRTHHEFFARQPQAARRGRGAGEPGAPARHRRATTRPSSTFYDQRVGEDVVSAAHFDRWWKQARRETARTCSPSTAAMLVNAERRRRSREDDYPDHWRQGGCGSS